MPYADPATRKEYAAQNLLKWRGANPEKVREQRRRSYARNAEKRRAASLAYIAAHREEINAKHRLRRKNNPRTQKNTNLWSKYRMTIEQYEVMVEAQRGLCFLCEDPGALSVDHDHQTGLVRKLLCVRCNVALGHFEGAILKLGIEKVLAYIGGEL